MPSIALGAMDEEAQDAEQAEDEEGASEEEEERAAPAASSRPLPVAPTLRVVFLEPDVLCARPDPRVVHVEGGPCAMLRQLLQASGAEVVLCGPWRRHHDYVLQVLTNFGVFGGDGEAAPQELQRTPRHGDATRRDLEILSWLRERRGRVAAWAALDASDLLRWPSAQHLEGHAVRVDGAVGLAPAHVAAALAALGCARPAAPPAGAAERPYGVAPRLRSALAWDDGLAGKMGALLSALAPLRPGEAAREARPPEGRPPASGLPVGPPAAAAAAAAEGSAPPAGRGDAGAAAGAAGGGGSEFDAIVASVRARFNA